MIRVLSAAVLKATHNSFSDELWGSWNAAGETLTQIMVVLFLPLFGDHSRVVFCQNKKSPRGTDWLATHTNLGTERQRRQDATKGPVRRYTVGCFVGVQRWGQPECGLSNATARTTDTRLTSLRTHWKSLVYPPLASLKLIVEKKKKKMVITFKLLTP